VLSLWRQAGLLDIPPPAVQSAARPKGQPQRMTRAFNAALLSLATDAPPHVITQRDVARHAFDVFSGAFRDYERLAKVFETSGVIERRAAMPLEWYLAERSFEERTAAYIACATELFASAARRALDLAGLRADAVDAVVTVSSTGIATPSLEARAAEALGFRPDVQRIPVFGLGCAGGATGLGIAARIAAAQPGAVVLLVVVELCTLSVRIDKPDKANLVAVALFGDGAAAAVLRGGSAPAEGQPMVKAAAERSWPGTLSLMGWDVDASGFSVIFDRAIPPFAESQVGPAMRDMLRAWGVAEDSVGRYVCHPGGAKVIAALETALGAPSGSLDHEREVLARFGNMSAPTVLFVLERAIAVGLPPATVAAALGPGFTLSAALLEAA
jgi:alkylresorcinol/alkylpyrone synthase